MSMHGEVTLVLTDINSGEVDSKTQKNTLVYNVIPAFITQNTGTIGSLVSNGSNRNYTIYAHTGKTYPSFTTSIVSPVQSVATAGYLPSGEFWPQWSEEPENNRGVLTFKARFDAPASTRTIDSIRLAGNIYFGSYTSTGHIAALDLVTPCTQSSTQILDIFYRIYINYSDSTNPNINNKGVDNLAKSKLMNYQYPPFSPGTSNALSWPKATHTIGATWNSPVASSTRMLMSADYDMVHVKYDSSVITTTVNKNQGTYKNSFNLSAGWGIGWLMKNSYLRATGQEFTTLTPITGPGDSKFQSVYLKTPHTASNVAYLDPSYIGQSQASISFNETGLQYKYPSMYRLNIVDGGDSSTATYKFSTRPSFGFKNNLKVYEMILPMDGYYQRANPTSSGTVHNWSPSWFTSNLTIYTNGRRLATIAIDDYTIASHSDIGVSILDLKTGAWRNIDANSTSPLVSTNIREIVYSPINNRLYVATADVGLKYIDLYTDTVMSMTPSGLDAGIDTTKAYTISLRSNGDLWCMFEGGLVKYSLGADSWAGYNANTTPSFIDTTVSANWNQTYKMVCDPVSTDDRICIAHRTNNSIVWWSPTLQITPVVTASRFEPIYGNEDNIATPPTIYSRIMEWLPTTDYVFNVYDYNRVIRRLAFGQSTQVLSAVVGDYNAYGHALRAFLVDGTWKLISVLLSGSSFSDLYVREVATDGTVSTVRSQTHLSDNLSGSGISYTPQIILNYSGLYVLTTHLYYQTFDDRAVFALANFRHVDDELSWEKYGWDGSSWVKGHASAKPVHSTFASLPNGSDVKFTYTGTTNDFVQNEAWTGFIYDGIHKDNTTTLSYATVTNVRRTYTETTLSNATIPTALGSITTPLNFYTSGGRDSYVSLLGEVGAGGSNEQYNANPVTQAPLSEIGFTGDFEITFKATPVSSRTEAEGGTSSFSIFNPSLTNDYFNKRFHFVENRFKVSNTVNSNLTTATTFTDSTIFGIKRVGTDVIFTVDGTSVYTFTNVTGTLYASVQFYDEHVRSFKDISATYSESRPVVKIGHASNQTGVFDPQFAMIESWCTAPRTTKVLIDGVAATITTDPTEALSAGKVLLLPKIGWLVFHSSDIGKTITAEALVLRTL